MSRLVDRRTMDEAVSRLSRQFNGQLEAAVRAERRKRHKLEDDVAALTAKVIKLEEAGAATAAALEAGQQRQDNRQASSGHQEANQDRQSRFPTGEYEVNGTKLDDMSTQAVIDLYNAIYQKKTAEGHPHAVIKPAHLRDDFMAEVADPWKRVPCKPGTKMTPRWSVFKAYCNKRRS